MYVQRRFMPQQKQNICILATNEPSLSTQPQWWKCLTSHPFLSWPLCSNPALHMFVHQLIDRQQKVEQEICYYIAAFTQNLQNFKETTQLPSISNQSQTAPTIAIHSPPTISQSCHLHETCVPFSSKCRKWLKAAYSRMISWDDRWPPYTDHEAVKKGGVPGELKNV